MKTTSKVFLSIVIFLFLILIYLKYFAAAGPDGLGTFFSISGVLVLFICFVIAFIVSFFTNSIKIPILICALGALSFIITLLYFSFDYTLQHKHQIEKNKKWLHTQSFKNVAFGIAFKNVSGTIQEYAGDTPVIQNVSITTENDIIIVPSEYSYSSPDYIKKSTKKNTVTLKKHLQNVFNTKAILKQCNLNNVKHSSFKNLPKESEIYKIEFSGTNEACRNAVVKNWMPNSSSIPQEIFFISANKNAMTYLILFINAPIQSIAAEVDKMGTSDVENNNKWYNTITVL